MARLLFLTSRLPYPPREGHQLRSWHLLRALAAQHEVTLLSFARRDDAPAECAPLHAAVAALETFAIPAEHSRRALAGAAARSLAGTEPFTACKYTAPALRARVAALLDRADLVHVDMLPLLANLPPRLRQPLVLNAHNVEHALLERRVPDRAQRPAPGLPACAAAPLARVRDRSLAPRRPRAGVLGDRCRTDLRTGAGDGARGGAQRRRSRAQPARAGTAQRARATGVRRPDGLVSEPRRR